MQSQDIRLALISSIQQCSKCLRASLLCRHTMAMLRPWRCCCKGRQKWTMGMKRGGPLWPWLPSVATLTVCTPSSARGHRRAPLTHCMAAPLSIWQVGSDHAVHMFFMVWASLTTICFLLCAVFGRLFLKLCDQI